MDNDNAMDTAMDSVMDAATLRILEFDKIRDMLVAKCVSEIGRQHARELAPSRYEAQILRDLAQTSEAEGFIMRNGAPPLGSIHDIRAILKRIELGASLNPAELLHIAANLRTARRLKRYGKDEARAAGSGRGKTGADAAGSERGGSGDTAAGTGRGADSNGNTAIGTGGNGNTAAARGGSGNTAAARGGSGDTAAGAGAGAADAASPGIPESDGIARLIAGLTENQRLENHISACVLSEEELADDASPALQGVRRQIRKMQDSIKDKLNAVIRSPKYQKFMQDSLVTIRQDRYVIPVKLEHKSEVSGVVHDVSASGSTVFIEPMAVVETNNEIRQLRVKEQLEIDRILAELTGEAAGMLPGLQANIDSLGLLDFLFAKGKLSVELGCSTPAVAADGRVRIKAGRHPLLPKSSVVPMDFWMGDGIDTVVVTGPNTGGKTVALKTVGLLTLMAQAGLNVPAASGSSLRVFRKVFADIGDEQSIEQSLSTFSSHMRNIVRVIAEADDGTLALFDEIGAGTDPAEGAAIATSILECLHQTGARTVATTHYSELKMYALTTAGVENACCEFDVATLRPTYRLLIGVPGKSNAFAISSKLGLPPAILARAREFLSNENIAFEDVLQNIEKNRAAAEDERRRTEGARLEAESLRSELERRKDAIESQREAVMREARESARRYVAESRSEAEAILSRLRKLEEEGDAEARRNEARELRNRLKAKADGIDEALAYRLPARKGGGGPARLRAGDDVVLVDLNKRATVVEPPNKNGDVVVRAGIISVNTHISNVRALDVRKEHEARAAAAAAAAGEAAAAATGAASPRGASGAASPRGANGAASAWEATGAAMPRGARGAADSGAGWNRPAGIAGAPAFGGAATGSGAQDRALEESAHRAAAIARAQPASGGQGTGAQGSRALNMRSELDLRGERLDAAISRVDRYLDDAALTGLHEVTIIHGKGTGALRAGIQEFLRGHPRAKAFRNGAYGEGDLGVTVVELR
jgi:DNA mismatch repair protein MutS2